MATVFLTYGNTPTKRRIGVVRKSPPRRGGISMSEKSLHVM